MDSASKKKATVLKVLLHDETTSSDSDDSLPFIECKLCVKKFSNAKAYQQHLKSQKHFKMVEKKKLKISMKNIPGILDEDGDTNEEETNDQPFARCDICQRDFPQPISYQQHLNGASHKKKLQQQSLVDRLKTELHLDEEKNENGGKDIFAKCEVCDKSFTGPTPYHTHLKSSTHFKEMKRSKVEQDLQQFYVKESNKFLCKECKKPFTDVFALKLHLENNNHEKQRARESLFDFVGSHTEIVAVKSVQNVTSEEETEEKGDYRNGQYFLLCKLCHTSFSGPESAQQHIESKKHLQTKKAKEERKLLKKMSENTVVNEIKINATRKNSSQNETDDFEVL